MKFEFDLPEKTEEILIHIAKSLDRRYPNAALDFWSAAARVNPDCDLAWYQIGKLLFDRADYGASVDALQRAALLTPTHAATLFALAKSCAFDGRYEEAVEALDRVLDLEPVG